MSENTHDPASITPDRLRRLAHAASRLHLSLTNRRLLLDTPAERFSNPDGSVESYPILTVAEYQDQLSSGRVSRPNAA